MALKNRCAFSDPTCEIESLPTTDSRLVILSLSKETARIVRSRDAQKTMTCPYKDRRPTDLFAAVLFSFQGANSAGFSVQCVSFDRIFALGRSSHDGYIIAGGYPCQARNKTFFRVPTNVATAASPDYQSTTKVVWTTSPRRKRPLRDAGAPCCGCRRRPCRTRRPTRSSNSRKTRIRRSSPGRA